MRRSMLPPVMAMLAAGQVEGSRTRRRDSDPPADVFEPGSEIFINGEPHRIAIPKSKTFPPEVLAKLAEFPQTREGIKAKKAYLKSLKLDR